MDMAIEGAPAGWVTDYRAEGFGENKDIGILFVHGFTGTPASMRPFAHYFNERGYRVSVPLLPGHGTKWQDLNEVHWSQWQKKIDDEMIELKKSSDKLFIACLSFGGTTALVAADHQDKLVGLILVNPLIHLPGIQKYFASLIAMFQKSRASVGDDIKKPGVTEWGYDALPMKGVAEMLKYLKKARASLPRIKVPLLIFHSKEDHVVPETNVEIFLDEIGSKDKERVSLLNSYHVATLDYDAEIIFEKSLSFVKKNSK